MYLTADPVAYTNLHLLNSPIVWNYVNCEHWNTDINHCTKTVIPDDVDHYDYYYYTPCTSTIVAGIRCAEGRKINQLTAATYTYYLLCSLQVVWMVHSSQTSEYW